MRRLLPLTALALLGAASPGRVDMVARILPPPAAPGKAVLPYVKVPDAKVALVHVRVIDGTGAAPLDDRTLLIDGGRIAAIQPGGDPVPAGYRTIDASGDSVIPGIVGMHDHQYYIARPNLTSEGRSEPPVMVPQMTLPRRACTSLRASRRCAPPARSSRTPTST